MLFIAKNDDEKFYVNPEDAEKYAEQGYSIIALAADSSALFRAS